MFDSSRPAYSLGQMNYSILFPLQFYRDVLDLGELAKLGKVLHTWSFYFALKNGVYILQLRNLF